MRVLEDIAQALERRDVVEDGQRPERKRQMGGKAANQPEPDALEAGDQPNLFRHYPEHARTRADLAPKHRSKQGDDDQKDLGHGMGIEVQPDQPQAEYKI